MSETIPLLKNGNPLCGGTLSVHWNEVYDGGVDIHISFEKEVLLETVAVTLAEDSAPTALTLYTEGKAQKLSVYTGETGQRIKEKRILLDAGMTVSSFVLTIDTSFSNISISDISLYGAIMGGETLFPIPDSFNETGERIPLSVFTGISAKDALCAPAVGVLTEKLKETACMTLSEAESGYLSLIVDPAVPKNGYRLSVTRYGAVISASDKRGFVIGAETFLKLVRDGSVPVCEIEDAPANQFRGVHLYLPAEEEFGFAKRLIKYLISPMGYNYVILEFAGGMKFDSHPEITAAVTHANEMAKAGKWPPFPHGENADGRPVDKELVRDYVAYIRSFGIEVIPEVQSLGHVQFMTAAHPDIAERPENAVKYDETDARLADVPPNDFYPHCYCPSNPKSYEILFDLMDEILEVVQPTEYVHAGHDEVYQIGVCPVCKKRDPADLYAEDVNKIHDYLAKRGLRMIIWSDMLQPVSPYKTISAIHKIPKDILFFDFIWYFHPAKDIEDNLLPEGFDLVYGNMYSSHFTRFEKRIRKPGVKGGQLSAWTQTSEDALGREGKIYDFFYTANMLWSDSYVSEARYAYDLLLRERMPLLREQLSGKISPALASGCRETVLFDKSIRDPMAEAAGLTVDIGRTCASLIFEHTAKVQIKRVPWIRLDVIGSYIVTYEDGETASVPVTYGGNIAAWNRRQNRPFADMYYRHNGYSATYFCDSTDYRRDDGTRVTFYQYEWINPRPDKKIVSVRYEAVRPLDVVVNKLTVID
ncbi:MAG: family 20 glycosylhydrolase [Clostridia bacterium]|nr:family 20 glycosylhydrolase [Clostridia bacterium]